MTLYEITRRGLEPFLLPLYKTVRKRIRQEVSKRPANLSILDVGGRKSPYTIGIPAKITVFDLPRETDVQTSLNLGINKKITNQLKANRSNLETLIIGDMTRCDLPDKTFEMVIAVEVLEHVEEDARFVSEVSRVLKPGGVFIMTTPNGDFVENKNPDHKRHYKLRQLADLLSEHFENVEVEYAIADGRFRKWGLRSWSARSPLRTASSVVGNVINSMQSSRPGIESRSVGTQHLFAVAYK